MKKTNYKNTRQVFNHFTGRAYNIKVANSISLSDPMSIKNISFFSKFLSFVIKRTAINKAFRRESK